MLGGLLCDLLGANRWEVFRRILIAAPSCAWRCDLTEDAGIDERLSAMLGRAWSGDGGGLLALLSGAVPYDDPLELLE